MSEFIIELWIFKKNATLVKKIRISTGLANVFKNLPNCRYNRGAAPFPPFHKFF